MADIISEMDNMTDDEIRMQIALIDNVNIPNAVKETGHRLINVLEIGRASCRERV